MAEVTNPIEVDNQVTEMENDSAYEDEITSLTTSLSSSITDYHYEHGRRFHAFEKGRYMFPNDEIEQERLDLHHHMFKMIIGGKLYTAPVKEPQRILDIGTGTGIWAMEIGDKIPSAEIIGVDLSPIQPSWVPQNVRFEVDDIEKPWTYTIPFDFVFSRYMCGSISDWRKLLGETYKHIKPGGWAEFQDYNLLWTTDDDSLSNEATVKKWNTLLLDAIRKEGKEPSPGPLLKQLLEEAGFKNVVEQVHKIPIGVWPKDRTLKDVGAWHFMSVLDGLEAFSIGPFTRVLRWSIEETQVLLAGVRKDLKNRQIHMYTDFHIVYGQKLVQQEIY